MKASGIQSILKKTSATARLKGREKSRSWIIKVIRNTKGKLKPKTTDAMFYTRLNGYINLKILASQM